MALRQIRTENEAVLRKTCKEVSSMTARNKQLIEDMFETMYKYEGVGLAASQVGILKRIVVIDIGNNPIVMINPVLIESEGEQTGMEGCLSIPGKQGQVTRPNHVKVSCYNENMEKTIIEGEELLARAMIHEMDHLDGRLYIDFVEGPLSDVEEDEEGEE